MSILTLPVSLGGFRVKVDSSLFWRIQKTPGAYSVVYAVPEIVSMEAMDDIALAAIVNACPDQGDEFCGSEIPWLKFDGEPVRVAIENSVTALKILKERNPSVTHSCLEVRCALKRQIKGFVYL